MTKTQEIRKEYGSFKAAVKHYAGIGCSRVLAAEYLGISLPYFRDLLKRHNLNGEFKPQKEMLRECRPRGGAWRKKGMKIPRRLKYSDEYLLEEVSRYPVSTTFMSMSDVDVSTIYRRFGSWSNAKKLSESTLTLGA